MDVVFVHGALVRDGEWWWRPTADLLLRHAGIGSRSVLLPSVGESALDDRSGGLVADAQALRDTLDSLDGTAIVVGHSYGGTVIAEAGHHPAIDHLVLISSYLPSAGSTQSDIMAGEPDPVTVEPVDQGALQLAGYDVSTFAGRFLHDAPESLRLGAWERTTPQSLAAFTTPTSMAGWQGVDSTYVVCLGDRSTSVALQRRHAAFASRAVEVATGHHPFLSRPDLIVEQLQRLS